MALHYAEEVRDIRKWAVERALDSFAYPPDSGELLLVAEAIYKWVALKPENARTP